MRRTESWSGDDGVEKDGRAIDSDIFFSVTKSDRLGEVVFLRLGVAGENSVFAVFRADVVEEEIAMRGFVVCPTSKSDAAAVTRAAIGGDEIGSGVAFDLLIPDVHPRAVAVELVSKDDVVFDRLLDKDTVASVAVAGVEEGGAVDGMGVEIDPVHIIPSAHIRDGVNTVRHVTPDSATVVSIHIAAIEKDGIAAFAVLRVDSVPGTCNQAGAFDQCDTSGSRVDGKLGLAICVQLSTRDRAKSFFWQKNNLSEGIGPCPGGLEWNT